MSAIRDQFNSPDEALSRIPSGAFPLWSATMSCRNLFCSEKAAPASGLTLLPGLEDRLPQVPYLSPFFFFFFSFRGGYDRRVSSLEQLNGKVIGLMVRMSEAGRRLRKAETKEG